MTMQLKAEAAVYGGYVLAREDGVVFIRGALPGELVEVEITEKKRDYRVASVLNVLEPSQDRMEPECRYFGECGGCQLQYAGYGTQVDMKTSVLTDCLVRIGGIEIEQLPPLTASQFHYRRRGQFKVSREGLIGFYKEGTREVVPISSCPLMDERVGAGLLALKQSDLPEGLSEVHVTTGDEDASVLLKGLKYDEAVASAFSSMGFQTVAFEDGTHHGPGYVWLALGGLKYTVSPWSFFQSNWELNQAVAGMIRDGLGKLDGLRVLDLYAGGGNFSLQLQAGGALVTAVEDNAYSIRDGRRNAALNSLHKMRFSEGRAESARIKGEFDVVLLNPPRPGLSGEALQRVLGFKPSRIAYVSCNPSTLARDLKKLTAQGYGVESVMMVDFFPNTFHIESLVFMSATAGTGSPAQ